MVMMKHNILCDFILGLLIMAFYCHAENPRHRLDVKKYLKSINKPALNSIKSPDGDIIDCVDISKQLAFDDPFLKNHTIQLRPTYYPEGLLRESSMAIEQLWHISGTCPEGTIYVRRIKEEDVLRAGSIKSFGKKHLSVPKPNYVQLDVTNNGHEHAITYVEGEKYYGTRATLNVWTPVVQSPDEFSLTQFWIIGGNYGSELNTIEAVWQVHQHLYGDQNTRLFTYWTRDAYQTTGCYNLQCSGFIQTNNKIALGATISPISGYQATQYDIRILVWKDINTGNWWMQFQNDLVGYWPSTLFTHLQESASRIEWGGEVINTQSDRHHTTTQMGSGHFPDEKFGKASFIINIQTVDGSNVLRDPEQFSTIIDRPDCYNIQLGNNKEWGSHFFYGGPGRNPNCP